VRPWFDRNGSTIGHERIQDSILTGAPRLLTQSTIIFIIVSKIDTIIELH
jgi:hypothetical protein